MRTLTPVSPGGIAKRFIRSTRMMDVGRHFLVIDGAFARMGDGVRNSAVAVVLM